MSHPFDDLTPDYMLDAVDAAGFLSDGRLLQLNSFENRVYQVGQEEGPPVIVKFYRPQRWSDEQILGIRAAGKQTDNPSAKGSLRLRRLLFVHDDDGRRTIADGGRIARGYGALFVKNRAQLGQSLLGRIGSNTLVLADRG